MLSGKIDGLSVTVENYFTSHDGRRGLAPATHRPRDIITFFEKFALEKDTIAEFFKRADLSDREDMQIIDCSAGAFFKQADHANRFFTALDAASASSVGLDDNQQHCYMTTQSVKFMECKTQSGEVQYLLLSGQDSFACVDDAAIVRFFYDDNITCDKSLDKIKHMAMQASYLCMKYPQIAADPRFAELAIPAEHVSDESRSIRAICSIKSQTVFNFLRTLRIRMQGVDKGVNALLARSYPASKDELHVIDALMHSLHTSNITFAPDYNLLGDNNPQLRTTLQRCVDGCEKLILTKIQEGLNGLFRISSSLDKNVEAMIRACDYAKKEFIEMLDETLRIFVRREYSDNLKAGQVIQSAENFQAAMGRSVTRLTNIYQHTLLSELAKVYKNGMQFAIADSEQAVDVDQVFFAASERDHTVTHRVTPAAAPTNAAAATVLPAATEPATDAMLAERLFTEATTNEFKADLIRRLSKALFAISAFDIEEFDEYKQLTSEAGLKYKEQLSHYENIIMFVYDLAKKIFDIIKNARDFSPNKDQDLLAYKKQMTELFKVASDDYVRYVRARLNDYPRELKNKASDSDDVRAVNSFATKVLSQVKVDVDECHVRCQQALAQSFNAIYQTCMTKQRKHEMEMEAQAREVAEIKAMLANADPEVAFAGYRRSLPADCRNHADSCRQFLRAYDLMKATEESKIIIDLLSLKIDEDNIVLFYKSLSALKRAEIMLHETSQAANVIALIAHPNLLAGINRCLELLPRFADSRQTQIYFDKLLTLNPVQLKNHGKLHEELLQLKSRLNNPWLNGLSIFGERKANTAKCLSNILESIKTPDLLALWLLENVNDASAGAAVKLLKIYNNSLGGIVCKLFEVPECLQRILELIFTNDPILDNLVRIIIGEDERTIFMCDGNELTIPQVMNRAYSQKAERVLPEWLNGVMNTLQLDLSMRNSDSFTMSGHAP